MSDAAPLLADPGPATASKPAVPSSAYWERRYGGGGNSGAGSYGRLADYKAAFLNDFVRSHEVTSILELGSGDGNQLTLLDFPLYTGVDVSETALTACRERFAAKEGWSFVHADDRETYDGRAYDLTLSLDVVYHLIEDETFERYMSDLFDLSARFVIVYASDWDQILPVWHVRHRWFTAWVAQNRPGWILTQRLKTPYPEDPEQPGDTTFAEFHVFERRPATQEPQTA